VTLSADSVGERIAGLLAYPETEYRERIEAAREALAGEPAAARHHLAEFASAVRNLSTEQLQELFTRTFDLNPVCVLEVGWQLYGDEYKRGEFLMKMQQSLAQHGLLSSSELPDHLTRVLPLLDCLPPEEGRALTCEFLVPAVRKMVAGIEGKQNPFEHVLKAVSEVLEGRTARVSREVCHD